MNSSSLLTVEQIQQNIFAVRGQQVMLDSDLAKAYGVTTKVFNQAVNRNVVRFPENFRFQLTDDEFQNLRSQLVTSSFHGGRRYLPYAFTEQGVAMLSAILRSETAIKVSIQIIQAFVSMRRFLLSFEPLLQRLDSLKKRQLASEVINDERFSKVFKALEVKQDPQQGIFYDGQMFDAYVFTNNLIRRCQRSIRLLDNYLDDTILLQLAKRKQGVIATIYTKTINQQLKLDLEKHNQQYPPIKIKKFDLSHDRFLILDDQEIFHFGASFKDLGKKWFAVSKMDMDSFEFLKRLS
ncbi:MAG: ORF6N domain-containing protein [Desulfomicrobium sp.]|nr:ORF6N domain-containing protein [Desulfomicrobium sp.]